MLKSHHILGTLEDFQREATRRGETEKHLGQSAIQIIHPEYNNNSQKLDDGITDLLEDVHVNTPFLIFSLGINELVEILVGFGERDFLQFYCHRFHCVTEKKFEMHN